MQSADLASVLDLPGPITVFAPVSFAFSKLRKDHLEFLKSPEVTCSFSFFSSLYFFFRTTPLTFDPQGHWKMLELLRHHVVPSMSVGGHVLLQICWCYSVPHPHNDALFLKLDVFTAVSGAQLMTMANQVLTVNVTEQVRCDSCHGLICAKQKI